MSARRVRVVIAGAGVAGLEALLALRVLAGLRTEVTLVSPESTLVERPMTTAEPFDRGIARRHDLRAIAEDQRARLLIDRVEAVRPEARVVRLGRGDELPYDALVVATGAALRAALPGAVTFGLEGGVAAMRAVLDDLRGGRARSAAFALASEASWPLPLYELALMTGAELRAAGVRGARLTVVTPEPAPLALFGPRAAEALAPLLADRGVAVRVGVSPAAVEPGRLALAGGGEVEADRVVALAAAVGQAPRGLPVDDAGFVAVDPHGRVPGLPGIYAAGDATAFPLKQGGLAAQQADAVAEAIAAELGAIDGPEPFRPVVRGLLLVGGAPLYLRAEPGSGRAATALASGRRSAAAESALWWPPAKIAGRYLGPYFATARPTRLGAEPLADRVQPSGGAARASRGHAEALDLALLLADSEAAAGDYRAAVRALEAAQALEGSLPPEYERKRARWLAAR